MLVISIMFGLCFYSSCAAVTSYQVQEIVWWHNKARAEISNAGLCTSMLEAEWNYDVATAAQANICPVSHNGYAADVYGASLGENLAWASNICTTGLCVDAGICDPNAPSDADNYCESNCDSICTIKNRVYSAWFQDETQDPNSVTDNCLSFNDGGGHCSQVVWQNSIGVGCDYQQSCDTWGTTVNCNYDPPGNYNVGSEVKIGDCLTGTPCADCPDTHPFCSTGDHVGLCSKFESSEAAQAEAEAAAAANAALVAIGSLEHTEQNEAMLAAILMPISFGLLIALIYYREPIVDAATSNVGCCGSCWAQTAPLLHRCQKLIGDVFRKADIHGVMACNVVLLGLAVTAAGVPRWTVIDSSLASGNTMGPWQLCLVGYGCWDLASFSNSGAVTAYINAVRALICLAALCSCGAVGITGYIIAKDRKDLLKSVVMLQLSICLCGWLCIGLYHGILDDFVEGGTRSLGWAGGLVIVLFFLSPLSAACTYSLLGKGSHNSTTPRAKPKSKKKNRKGGVTALV